MTVREIGAGMAQTRFRVTARRVTLLSSHTTAALSNTFPRLPCAFSSCRSYPAVAEILGLHAHLLKRHTHSPEPRSTPSFPRKHQRDNDKSSTYQRPATRQPTRRAAPPPEFVSMAQPKRPFHPSSLAYKTRKGPPSNARSSNSKRPPAPPPRRRCRPAQHHRVHDPPRALDALAVARASSALHRLVRRGGGRGERRAHDSATVPIKHTAGSAGGGGDGRAGSQRQRLDAG